MILQHPRYSRNYFAAAAAIGDPNTMEIKANPMDMTDAIVTPS